MIDFSLFIFYLLTIIYLETYIRGVFKDSHLNLGMALSTLFGIIFASLLFMVSTGFGPVANKIITYALTFALCFLFASQLVYYKIFRTFYIVYSAGNAGDVMEFVGIALAAIRNNLLKVSLAFVPFISLWILENTGFLGFESSLMSKLSFLVLGILSHILGLLIVNKRSEKVNSPNNLYHNIHHPEFSIENLGLLTYMRLDLKRQLFGWTPKNLPNPDLVKEYVEMASTSGGWYTSGSFESLKSRYNIMDIPFSSLAASEKNPKLSSLHRYFSLLEPEKKNRYTGMFKGYNLVFITAESFSHLAVRRDITPTLYRMVHEGVNFTDFYTPIWGVSTTDGEYVATMGLLPKTGVWSYTLSKGNLLPFSMGNQLGKLCYTTKAYHNHSYDYYERNLTHVNMGYEYKGVGNGLELDHTWPESDLQMMEKTIPEYVNDERFHAYYMTVSGHLRYKFGANDISDKNRSKVEDLPYSDNIKAYLATQVELDLALEHLLNSLDEKGLAEKTLIVLSADHYPYGLSLNEFAELSGHQVDTNFQLYRNGLILYAKGMEPIVVDTPSSSLDIIPTLSNLLGLDYDSRLLMGRDLFSDSSPLVIFSNRSFISDRGRFNSETGEFIWNDAFSNCDGEEAQRYRKTVSNQIDAKFLYSGWMLETDYYRKLMDGQ